MGCTYKLREVLAAAGAAAAEGTEDAAAKGNVCAVCNKRGNKAVQLLSAHPTDVFTCVKLV